MECRCNLKLSIEEVANHIGVNPDQYLGYEEGRLHPTGDTIILLAKLFVQDFRYLVTNDYRSADKQINALFRQNENLSKYDRLGIQKFVRLCEYKSFFEELLGKTKSQVPDYTQINLKIDNPVLQGKRTAYLERKRLRIEGPVSNIYSILRSQNINLFRREMEDGNISGVYVNYPNVGHCILVNYQEDIYRQNFSAAHEYAHALFDSASDQSITYLKDKGADIRERRANSFARHFLVPDHELKKITKPNNYNSLIDLILRLCHHFKVSRYVIIYRLQDIGWYKEEASRKLLKEIKLIIPKNDKEDPELIGLSTGFKDKLD
nr:XRE family transcriptional regulator [Desulforamulus aquiferis]